MNGRARRTQRQTAALGRAAARHRAQRAGPDELRQLRERERQLAGIVDTAMDAIITIDADHRIRLFNAAAARIFRIDAAQAIGSPIERFVPIPARAVHADHLRHFGRTGSTSRRMGALHVLRGQRADGSSFPIEASISKHGDGAHVLMTAVLRDMSDAHDALRAREAQLAAEAASRAKTAFISRMSHELRTPLNAVLGFLQLLEVDPHQPLSETQRRYLGLGRDAGRHLAGLIDDLLDVARIESGELRIEPRDVDVAEVVQSACGVVEAEARGVGVTLHPDRLDGLVVRADAARLRQVLINLLSNGAKYNRPGGTVRVQAVADGERLHLDVVDDGIGMDATQRTHLFEPFNRLGRETSAVPGTGIGLSLSRQLVEAMGGSIEVHSAVGQGTRMRITLPGRRLPASALPVPPLEPGLCGCVLYIEDNPVNRLLLQQYLGRWPGLRLVLAETGAEGIAQAQSCRPDLVLIDLHLPDMDGHAVLRRLRAEPALGEVPLVMLSAESDRRVVDAALRAGACDYWTKPFDFDRIEAALNVRLATA